MHKVVCNVVFVTCSSICCNTTSITTKSKRINMQSFCPHSNLCGNLSLFVFLKYEIETIYISDITFLYLQL